ncbi:MAG: hypothetical protein IPO16_07320 [Saprospiraceae bacterium]|nr:hypothetical protein [Saprospiraceae bacterium]
MVKSSLFKSGILLMTSGVSAACAEDVVFSQFLSNSIRMHLNGNWGDVGPEDKESNFQALENGGRIFSVYKPLFTISKHAEKIWIITEADRSSTTILFPNEY